MKEFIVLIHAEGTPILQLSKERREQHIQKVGKFIGTLAQSGNLKNAQPFEPIGVSLSGQSGSIIEKILNAGDGDVVGFYHITAETIEEAAAIVKSDPRFEDTAWKMDIWPILKIEGIN